MLQNIVIIAIAIAVAGVAFVVAMITTRRSTDDVIDSLYKLRRDNDRVVDILIAHGDKIDSVTSMIKPMSDIVTCDDCGCAIVEKYAVKLGDYIHYGYICKSCEDKRVSRAKNKK